MRAVRPCARAAGPSRDPIGSHEALPRVRAGEGPISRAGTLDGVVEVSTSLALADDAPEVRPIETRATRCRGHVAARAAEKLPHVRHVETGHRDALCIGVRE